MEISFQINTFWQLKLIANLIGYKNIPKYKELRKKLIVLINVKTIFSIPKLVKVWKIYDVEELENFECVSHLNVHPFPSNKPIQRR